MSNSVRNATSYVRAAIDETIVRGVEIVRKLDAVVKNKYANNAAILAEWTSVSHTERNPRRAKAAPQPTPMIAAAESE